MDHSFQNEELNILSELFEDFVDGYKNSMVSLQFAKGDLYR